MAIIKPAEQGFNKTAGASIDNLRIYQYSDCIVVTGEQILGASLFSLSGNKIIYAKSSADKTICKIQTTLLRGIYILKIDGTSYSETRKVLIK